MTDRDRYKETFSQVHSRRELNWEEFEHMERKRKKYRPLRFLAAAAAVALALTVLWGSAAVPLPKRPSLLEVPQRLQSWPQRWSDSLDGALSRFNDMFDDLGGTVLRSAQGGNP